MISSIILGPVGENVRKSLKTCEFGTPLNGSDDDKIMFNKYGACTDLLEHLKCLEDTDVDPFEGIPKDQVSLEDVP